MWAVQNIVSQSVSHKSEWNDQSILIWAQKELSKIWQMDIKWICYRIIDDSLSLYYEIFMHGNKDAWMNHADI